MSRRVLVLGGTGMLGAMMVRVLQEQGMEVVATTRGKINEAGWIKLDAFGFALEGSDAPLPRSALDDADWIVNCIGITKPMIEESNDWSMRVAITVNSLFPLALAHACDRQRIIQIATDCVFSGRTGNYKETDAHDALDVYGKTKSLGEAKSPNIMHLRTSIIGPEFRPEKKFLLEWLLGQTQGAIVKGYTNHTWNGLTTLHFAKICAAIINIPVLFKPGVHHLSPANTATKYQLLYDACIAFGRQDIQVEKVAAPESVYRHLDTVDDSFGYALWQGDGYEDPPTTQQMLEELAAYMSCSTSGDIIRKGRA